jgi:hypothetical protein
VLAANLLRLENAPSKIEITRMMGAMLDLFCASWARPPKAITLDIDDTLDRVHGHQQLSLFNAHFDERCFLPIHIYEAGSGKPVAVTLREGKTPGGAEVRAVIKHVVRRIRRHWPKTRICWRGRQPLCPVRSDGMVRGERHRSSLRARRQRRAARRAPCRRR